MSDCKIQRPDPQELFDKLSADFSNTMLGGAPVIPESNEWYMTAFHYEMMESFYAIASQATRERDPRYACADNLLKIAAEDGVLPRAAKAAQGVVKITGEAGAAIPSPLEIEIEGQTFIGTPSLAEIPSGGTLAVPVAALVPGADGNISTEATFTVDDLEIELCGGATCGGCEEEGVEQLRQRYLSRIRYQPRARAEWLLGKALEWPCATRAILRAGSCCTCDCDSTGQVGSSGGDCEKCGCAECGGGFDLYVMFDATFPNGIAPREVLDDVQEWLFGKPQGYGLGCAEIGVCGRVVSVAPVEFDMTVTVDGCPSPGQLGRARDIVSEFASTIEPSKPIATDDLVLSLSRAIPGLNFTAIVDLADPSVGYGNMIGPKLENSQVFVTPCGFEPECDFMMVLRNLNITSQVQSATGC